MEIRRSNRSVGDRAATIRVAVLGLSVVGSGPISVVYLVSQMRIKVGRKVNKNAV